MSAASNSEPRQRSIDIRECQENASISRKSDRDHNAKSGTPSPGGITTLHMSNLPTDVTGREVRNLVVLLEGYEGSTLRVTGRPVAFIKFATRRDAEHATRKLAKFAFDPRYPDTYIRVEFARREMNMEVAKRPRIDYHHQHPDTYGPPHGENHYGTPAGAASFNENHYRTPAGYPAHGSSPPMPRNYKSPVLPGAAVRRSTAPCDTLCVQGLGGADAQLHDLKQNFQRLYGFVAQKVPVTGRPYGFIKFESGRLATQAMQVLHNQNLTSWVSGMPLVIEYAKRSFNP